MWDLGYLEARFPCGIPSVGNDSLPLSRDHPPPPGPALRAPLPRPGDRSPPGDTLDGLHNHGGDSPCGAIEGARASVRLPTPELGMPELRETA